MSTKQAKEEELILIAFGESECCNDEEDFSPFAGILFAILISIVAVILFSPYAYRYMSTGKNAGWDLFVKGLVLFIIVYVLLVAFGSGGNLF